MRSILGVGLLLVGCIYMGPHDSGSMEAAASPTARDAGGSADAAAEESADAGGRDGGVDAGAVERPDAGVPHQPDAGGPLPPDAGPGSLPLSNVRTAGNPLWGVQGLDLPSYQVAVDGILVVSASWNDPTQANTPTFNGTNLTLMAHQETTLERVHIAHAAMYFLPVIAGQSGLIQITFPGQARGVCLTAATIPGATVMVSVRTAVANVSPSLMGLDLRIDLTAPATVMTMLGSSATIDSVLTGTGHVQVSNPTVPLNDFHDARSYTGFAALGSGSHTLGFEQDPASAVPSPQQIYDAVMVAGIFR